MEEGSCGTCPYHREEVLRVDTLKEKVSAVEQCQSEMKKDILERMTKTLKPGGTLILGG